MQSITVNLAGDHHEPTVKLLLNDHRGCGFYFAVLDLGETSIILPGENYGTVAYLYKLAAALEVRAQELEATLAADPAAEVAPS